eukprot:jgi/Pico_ML_1/51916/g2708.t1
MVRGVCSCFEKAGAHLADAGAKKRAMANVEAHDRAEVLYPRKQKVSIWIDLAQKRLEGYVITRKGYDEVLGTLRGES